jgi:hypothetical protein
MCLYPPTEFGQQINVSEYVEAMQRKPALLKQFFTNTDDKALTENEVKAASDIVDLFTERLTLGGLFVLYACSYAYSKKVPFDAAHVSLILRHDDDSYIIGIIVATAAAGLISYTKSPTNIHLLNIIEMNLKLKVILKTAIDNKIKIYTEGDYKDDEGFINWSQGALSGLDEYFN